MEIKTYTQISNEIIPNIYRLSELMEDCGENKRRIFAIVLILLEHHKGLFFISYSNDDKVSFGMLSFGMYDNLFRRILFFAVERDKRAKGIGHNTLELLIKNEIKLDSGCSLSCAKSLKSFYERLGFKYACDSINSNPEKPIDEISFLLTSDKCDTNADKFGIFTDVMLSDSDVISLCKEYEEMYNISLFVD